MRMRDRCNRIRRSGEPWWEKKMKDTTNPAIHCLTLSSPEVVQSKRRSWTHAKCWRSIVHAGFYRKIFTSLRKSTTRPRRAKIYPIGTYHTNYRCHPLNTWSHPSASFFYSNFLFNTIHKSSGRSCLPVDSDSLAKFLSCLNVGLQRLNPSRPFKKFDSTICLLWTIDKINGFRAYSGTLPTLFQSYE